MIKKTLILTGFIVLKFILQYILISPAYDLQRDEYLYLDQANHLAFGYLSVPPVTSWISYIIKFLGNSVFWIKFFPAFFGSMTILVVWKTIEELRGNLFALTLGATCVLFSILLRLNTLYQPNSLDVLCWTAFYFVVIKYINTEKPKWLYVGAVVLAIGFLNKYNIVFLLIGLFPAFMMTAQRKLLLNKNFLIAISLFLLLILPNLIWQYNNQFPVFNHLRELSELQLVNVNRWDFLKSQLLFFTGSLFVIISALIALWSYEPYGKYRPFFWSIIFTLIVFMYFRAKDYYAVGIYPIYIAFGAVYLADLFERRRIKILQPIAIAVPILFFIPMYHVAFPNKSPEYFAENGQRLKTLGLLRWEDGNDYELPQDYADMLGWKELAYKVDKVYSSLPNQEMTLILCDNYGQAGAINYYSTQGIRAVSFNADYINWFNLDQEYINLIRIKRSSEREMEWEKTSPYFHTALIADSVTNHFAREYGTTIFAFIDTKVDINERIKIEIEEVKNFR
ncbi:ArnT family glycosyltransferase [Pararhodonellum marinum]|uniref:ArnT family glycosyltransferase n=1 Tax=Pararhodonellum marinum TaxID=2755358 RepID=UPI00188ECF59|nr:glycosyltransferase family 39 protein [Pararhodonellum marinum]